MLMQKKSKLSVCLCPQAKLEEALTLATDFHNSLQDFIVWLTQAEQTLNMVSSASLILETIMFQIDEHKVMCRETEPLVGKIKLTKQIYFRLCIISECAHGIKQTLKSHAHFSSSSFFLKAWV